MGCASPGRTCNNCLFTFALFAVPWSPSLSLCASFTVSCGPASYCLVGHAPKLLAPCQDRARHRGSTENFPPLCLCLSLSRPALPKVSTVSRPNPRHSLSQLGANSRNVRPSIRLSVRPPCLMPATSRHFTFLLVKSTANAKGNEDRRQRKNPKDMANV